MDPREPWVDRALSQLLADSDQARALAGHALQQAQGDPAAQALALLALGLAELRGGNLDAGLACLARAEPLLATHGTPRARWLATHLQAHVHRMRGELPQARALLEALHAQAAARPVVDAFHTAMALGTVQGMSDDYAACLGSYYQGLALARRSGEPSLEANALNNLGAQQLDLHNLEDALPLLQRCLALALGIGSRRQTIFAAGNLVQCLCAMGDAAQALALARRHLVALIRPDDPPNLQRDEEIALALLDNGLPDEAQAYLARTPCHDVLTNPVSACRTWLDARLLLAQGRAADALRRCQAAQALLDDDTVVPADRVHLAEFTAELAAGQGDWAQAYAYQRRAYALKDLLLGRAARARHLSLQIAHELKHTQDERDAARQAATRLEQANALLHQQMAANDQLRRQLEALALEDPLTGLANRRQLFLAGQALLAQARRDGFEVVVALIDLDHFKSINDRHGHDVGDQVLTTFGALLRSAVRAGDLCARHGGEEFVLVLPRVDLATAQARVAQLLQQWRHQGFSGAGGVRFHTSFSAGLAGPTACQAELPALLQQADRALYRAKAAGRARVALAAPEDMGVNLV